MGTHGERSCNWLRIWTFWCVGVLCLPLSQAFLASVGPRTMKFENPSNQRQQQLIGSSSSLWYTGDPMMDFSNQHKQKEDAYLRWNQGKNGTWQMQTAVRTFKRGNQTVELHAQLHFGSKDYFAYFNSNEFTTRLDNVHYELLVDEGLLDFIPTSRTWRLSAPIMASPNDQQMARQYEWECQASQVDYTHPKWIHADLTRQEFLKSSTGQQGKPRSNQDQKPLWQIASGTSQSFSALSETASALFVGPPTLLFSQSGTNILRRRLFTNLFLAGSALGNSLRAVLWMTVPAPELSIILLDWSSLLKGNRMSMSGNPSAFSEVALPVLSSLVKLDLLQMRRFLFGQVLASSSDAIATSSSIPQDQDASTWSLLVGQRNDRALDVLYSSLAGNAQIRTALLYGSSHCADLEEKLQQRNFILDPRETVWRTAWTVQETRDPSLWPALVLATLLYLVVGALDWVEMLGDVSQVWTAGGTLVEAEVAAGLYLLRHVLLYLGLSRFLVDWTSSSGSSSGSSIDTK